MEGEKRKNIDGKREKMRQKEVEKEAPQLRLDLG
jgi:hypothetical protein